jgi:hypothetical protein
VGGAVGRLEGVLRRVEVVVPAGATRVGAVLVVGVLRAAAGAVMLAASLLLVVAEGEVLAVARPQAGAAADAAGVLVGERWEAALKCRSKNTGTLECLLPEEKRMPLSHAT